MRAVQYRRAGPAAQVLEIRELADCEPGPGEVRVAVHFSAVNPTDVKRRSSENPGSEGYQIPHHDGSGFIDSVGEGVSQERIGERVWLYHAAHDRAHGTAAESVCIPSEQAVAIPAHRTLAEASLLGIPAMTAAHAIRTAALSEHQTLLVTGGGGAVGSAAISLGRQAGLRVVATVSSPQKAEIALSSGANEVIDYTQEDLSEVLRARKLKINAAIDVAVAQHLPTYQDYLADKARIVAYSSDVPQATIAVRLLMFANARIDFFVIYRLSQQEIIQARDDVTAAFLAGFEASTPLSLFDFVDCAAAHEYVEARSLGRAVVRVRHST